VKRYSNAEAACLHCTHPLSNNRPVVQLFIHLERSRALSEQTFRSLVSADRLDKIARAWCLSLRFRSSNPVARDIFVERTGQVVSRGLRV
jgi:hypothetical protein